LSPPARETFVVFADYVLMTVKLQFHDCGDPRTLGIASRSKPRNIGRTVAMVAAVDRESPAIWHQWAGERARSGCLEQMITEELYDHTWEISASQIVEILGLKPGQTVVDAGSGWGRLIHALKVKIPSLQIRGYELTPEFVERSRNLLAQTHLDGGVVIERADLTQAELPPNTADAFYSSRVLHYIKDKHAAVARLYGCLKPGGRGLIIIPNRSCPYRWFTYRHARLYPVSRIGEIMQDAGFRDLRYGGFGFFPSHPRLRHTSIACGIDRRLSHTPLGRLAGLAYVTGTK
jgi:SAM-dependent methyltransferase